MRVAIFLSHSTRDDATVAALRAALERYAMWPSAPFQHPAHVVEAALPRWG